MYWEILPSVLVAALGIVLFWQAMKLGGRKKNRTANVVGVIGLVLFVLGGAGTLRLLDVFLFPNG